MLVFSRIPFRCTQLEATDLVGDFVSTLVGKGFVLGSQANSRFRDKNQMEQFAIIRNTNELMGLELHLTAIYMLEVNADLQNGF